MKDEERGVVERRNRDNDANGLVDRETDFVETSSLVCVKRQRIAVQLRTLEGGQSNDFSRSTGFTSRLENRLAVFSRHNLRDVFGTFIGERSGFGQNRESSMGGSPPPGLKSLDRGIDSAFRVGRSSEGNITHDIPVKRGRDVFTLARAGVYPLPANK